MDEHVSRMKPMTAKEWQMKKTTEYGATYDGARWFPFSSMKFALIPTLDSMPTRDLFSLASLPTTTQLSAEPQQPEAGPSHSVNIVRTPSPPHQATSLPSSQYRKRTFSSLAEEDEEEQPLKIKSPPPSPSIAVMLERLKQKRDYECPPSSQEEVQSYMDEEPNSQGNASDGENGDNLKDIIQTQLPPVASYELIQTPE
jgi:hypothetical protein